MIEEEQIQEMAVTMKDCCVYEYFTDCKRCPLHKSECLTYNYAKILYNAGYRKVELPKVVK